ncbi:MAG: EF-hand domain-containing protein [Sphingomonas sp.]|jgi:Ca2+-binding EF-hand superfamily protein
MRFSILLACCSLAAPALAQEQSAPPPATKPLHHFDDGPPPSSTPREHRAFGPTGQLFVAPSGQPFRAPFGEAYPVATWFAQADTNHDGKIDRGELAADFERFFNTLDLDHNGILENDEIGRYEREILPEIRSTNLSELDPAAIDGRPGKGGFGGGGHRRHGEGGGNNRLGLTGNGGGQDGGGDSSPPALRLGAFAEPISGAGHFGLINIAEPITSMDADLDGTVNFNEMRRAAGRRFDLLDPDGVGYLTLADLPRAPADHGGGHGERDKGRRRR